MLQLHFSILIFFAIHFAGVQCLLQDQDPQITKVGIEQRRITVNDLANEKAQADIIDLHKSAQLKLKRLKELRAEVRLLSEQFKNEQNAVKGKQTGDSNKPSTSITTANNWKKKFRNSLRKINKRLNRLEKQMKMQKNRRIQQPRSGLASNSTTSSTHVRKSKKKGNESRRNGSSKSLLIQMVRPGNYQGDESHVCASHKDCKPGLCCHRQANITVGVGSNISRSHCVKYVYKEGAVCEHSCSCESHLHCFRDQRTALIDSKEPPKPARCKKATNKDLISGHYENSNSADSFFIDTS